MNPTFSLDTKKFNIHECISYGDFIVISVSYEDKNFSGVLLDNAKKLNEFPLTTDLTRAQIEKSLKDCNSSLPCTASSLVDRSSYQQLVSVSNTSSTPSSTAGAKLPFKRVGGRGGYRSPALPIPRRVLRSYICKKCQKTSLSSPKEEIGGEYQNKTGLDRDLEINWGAENPAGVKQKRDFRYLDEVSFHDTCEAQKLPDKSSLIGTRDTTRKNSNSESVVKVPEREVSKESEVVLTLLGSPTSSSADEENDAGGSESGSRRRMRGIALSKVTALKRTRARGSPLSESTERTSPFLKLSTSAVSRRKFVKKRSVKTIKASTTGGALVPPMHFDSGFLKPDPELLAKVRKNRQLSSPTREESSAAPRMSATDLPDGACGSRLPLTDFTVNCLLSMETDAISKSSEPPSSLSCPLYSKAVQRPQPSVESCKETTAKKLGAAVCHILSETVEEPAVETFFEIQPQPVPSPTSSSAARLNCSGGERKVTPIRLKRLDAIPVQSSKALRRSITPSPSGETSSKNNTTPPPTFSPEAEDVPESPSSHPDNSSTPVSLSHTTPLERYCNLSTGVEFRKGDIVWAKITGYPHWPAKISSIQRSDSSDDCTACVSWYAWDQVSYILCDKLFHFKPNFRAKFEKKRKGSYRVAVDAALLEVAKRGGGSREASPTGEAAGRPQRGYTPPGS